ncbi:MAG TPA: enoyl-CoA hydratase/isomerase family protein [Thermoanaerobaculia bacterium]|nr:enoyl-CoA hydratase/isomerase family protein [Thermoanaerobaculia bacterium]
MIERTEKDGISILRLAHGKASALDLELLEELRRHFQSETAGALVLTGTGSIFSAGVDLFRLTREGRAYVEEFVPALVSMLEALFTKSTPVVSAVNGHAIAGGFILNAAADYRIMAAGNGRIGVPELLVGVPFPALALEIVRFSTPNQHVQELVYTGKTVLPDEALAKGIVDEVVEASALLDRAVAVAQQLAAIPRQAFSIVKRQLRQPYVERAHSLARADRDALEVWADPATHEHIRAYLEKTVGRK